MTIEQDLRAQFLLAPGPPSLSGMNASADYALRQVGPLPTPGRMGNEDRKELADEDFWLLGIMSTEEYLERARASARQLAKTELKRYLQQDDKTDL